MFDDFTLWSLFLKGGPVMIVLIVFSVASLAVIVGKVWSFRSFRLELADGFRKLAGAVNDGGISAALTLARSDDTVLSKVFLAGHAKRAGGRDEILRSMEITARSHVSSLERYLGVLGTVGSTSPFVGLFGTVLGIITAFRALAIAEGAGPAVVADGIAVALVATAGGLLVAIPAVIAYNYFVRAVQRISVELEASAYEFVEAIFEDADSGDGGEV